MNTFMNFYDIFLHRIHTNYLVEQMEVWEYIKKGHLSKDVRSAIQEWINEYTPDSIEPLDLIWNYIYEPSHKIDMLDLDLDLIYPSKSHDTLKEILTSTLRYILNKQFSKFLTNKYGTRKND